MLPLELFLFDMAGTTVRDDDHVLEAFARTAQGAGLDLERSWLLPRMGLHKEAVFRELLEVAGRSSDAAPSLARAFEDAIEDVFRERPASPLPGAVELLNALEQAGVRVGFTTGFSRRTADGILRALGWQERLSVCSDEVAQGRPAPDLIFEAMRRAGVDDANRVGTCGDTPSDLGAGANAGCAIVVGVGHGTHDLASLAPHPHTHLFPDLEGLRALLEV